MALWVLLPVQRLKGTSPEGIETMKRNVVRLFATGSAPVGVGAGLAVLTLALMHLLA